MKSSHKLTRPFFIASVTLGISLWATSPAIAAPTLTITPPTGLTDGQTVTASGQGYTPNTQIAIAQCDLDFTDRAACTPGGVTVIVGSDGTFSVAVTASKSFTGYDPDSGRETGTVDCATDTCGFAAADVTALGTVLGVGTISFA
ncbi:enediyne antibiotic chromoprotein [Streptomyces cremeus]|uniref:Enediyne antibiotic chromoprotein n=1 Tax=Streptomyces cremeus TaxID=66881 RepID=A0ABV5PMT9_STRCM